MHHLTFLGNSLQVQCSRSSLHYSSQPIYQQLKSCDSGCPAAAYYTQKTKDELRMTKAENWEGFTLNLCTFITGCPAYHVPLGFLHFSGLKLHP